MIGALSRPLRRPVDRTEADPTGLRLMRSITTRLIGVGGTLMLLLVLPHIARASAGAGMEQTPLTPRTGAAGATLFTPVPAQQSGVITENNYSDPSMWAERYQELTYGAIGTGIAIGDFDNDGLPDIFVASKTESSRLFRNLGNWKFEDVTERAGLSPTSGGWAEKMKGLFGSSDPKAASFAAWKQGVTFADVNNDGWLDLYVCCFGAPNLLFINQHDGTFKEEAAPRGLAVSDGCGMAAFCDFDRDGWLDVYVQTNMLNAAAHPNGQRDYLFRNNRDGTFTNVTDAAGIAGESSGHSVTWWDYNADGWPDIYVANDFGTPDCLYRNNRDGTFTNVISDVVPHMPYYAMGSDLGDVNNDGLFDLFVADMAPTTHAKDQRGMAGSRARTQVYPSSLTAAPQYMRNALYVNTGTGRMLEAATMAGLSATDWTWSVRFEDLDNDGRVDLHVTNGMNREYHNADLLERSMRSDDAADPRKVIRGSPVLAESHLAFRNLGDLRFENVSAAWGLDQKAVSFGAAFADFDGDGDLDLICSNYGSGPTMLRNDSATGHRLIVALRGTVSNSFGVGAVVRIESPAGVQVRQLVLARGYLSASEPIVHFGLGEDSVISKLTVQWPSGQVQTFENVSADQHLVITEPGARAAASSAVPRLSNTASAASPPMFSAAKVPQGVTSPKKDVRVEADFDHDGVLDAFVGGQAVTGKYPVSAPSALLRQEGGSWVDVTDSLAPTLRKLGLVTAALWTDVDDDGWIDLLIASEWSGVRFFHNDHGHRFDDWSDKAGFSAAGKGWWSALAASDFNGDGHLDYAVGNLGLNTRYQASAARPALLFQGDFGGTSQIAIEGYYEGDRLYPWITRNELGTLLPAIMRKFPRNDVYARSSLGEIVGEDRLAAAKRYEATEFRSGVFLSQPDGRFRFEPLPRIAQLSPVRALAVGDIDGDGKADLYAVQNSDAPPASTGRFDGGVSQLLLGNGHGGFTPVAPLDSALIVPGEATSVSVVDLNGDRWPDFVVTRAGRDALAFQNTPKDGRGFVTVELRGRAQNSKVIGAQVTTVFADSSTQTAEFSGGSGALHFIGYERRNPPRLVRVRWPDGRRSEHHVDANSMVLSEPPR
jgi:hypothetical protein